MDVNKNDRVVLQNIAPFWNGKVGVVVRWVNDDWYIVECDGTELVIDASRNEMRRYDNG